VTLIDDAPGVYGWNWHVGHRAKKIRKLNER